MQALANHFFHILVIGLQQTDFPAQRQIFRVQTGDLLLQSGILPLEFTVFHKTGGPPDHATEQNHIDEPRATRMNTRQNMITAKDVSVAAAPCGKA